MNKHDEARLNIDEQNNSSRKALHQYVDEAEETEKKYNELIKNYEINKKLLSYLERKLFGADEE